MSVRRSLPALLLGVALSSTNATAQTDARMFRYPDVSATEIAFVYAGDIWVVAKAGGVAHRLSSPAGEESFPRFSPDGSRIAFSANYDGNTDTYVMPTVGGEPVRVTYHPMGDRLVDWHPDGRLLIASGRESGRQRYSQLYLVGAGGGLPTKLPVPYGEFGAFSADGRYLAYTPTTLDFRTWKRYRGGWAPDIWVFDLSDSTARNISPSDADDSQPMWHGDALYFLSDRGPEQRHNIWRLDAGSSTPRQVTRFRDFDVTFPAIGPADMVFQAGGRLHLLDLATDTEREVAVEVITDRRSLRPRVERVAGLIQSVAASPTGQRALFQARGEILTVPAEHGPVLNLSRTSGVAERYPTWSPDGKTIAYWTDRTGEYQLALRPADGSGEERILTTMGPGYRYQPWWSPDGKQVAFADEAMRFHLYDLDRRSDRVIDSSRAWMAHGQLQAMRFNWSADSRWLTWSRAVESTNQAVFLYDTRDNSLHRATPGYLNATTPVFDPEGAFLYYTSDRTFDPVYGSFDNTWTYANPTVIVAVPLRRDVASPLAARNDAEGADTAKRAGAARDTAAQADSAHAVNIDLEGFAGRAVILPPPSGNYADLAAAKGKVIYRRTPRTGSSDSTSTLAYWDLAAREEKSVLENVDDAILTADGKKLLVRRGRQIGFIDLKPAQKLATPLRTGEMEMVVDPRAEWHQMFADAYRFERDYFYDPGMHGVDWDGLRKRYGALIDDAVTRWDVNFVLGEFIAELNASHTYRGGGDEESAPTRRVAMLGVDWALENGAYRIARIVTAAPWDIDVRSPLAEPGLRVSEGDYVLAANGVPLDPAKDPWASFQDLGESPLLLTVNSRPTMAGARQVVVKPITNETELRFRAWIEERRARVDQATNGRVGYIYVQSTGVDAQNELVRQFMAQYTKDGLIIDERWNSGGQIPDRFVELLNRPMLSYYAVRHGIDWRWPPVAHRGPKVMLMNGWSGSGGDAFPFYFKQAGVGPLIGTRTWGGLIGISGAPPLVDGGGLTVPTFRAYDVNGTWFPEGVGVAPDIEVKEDPAGLARGVDGQLERAISEVMRMMREQPPAPPARPVYEKRVP